MALLGIHRYAQFLLTLTGAVAAAAGPVREGDRSASLASSTTAQPGSTDEQEPQSAVPASDSERGGFPAVLRQLPFGVVIAEAPSGRITFANEYAERIYRRPPSAPGSVDEYVTAAAWHLDGRPYEPPEYPIVRALNGETIRGEEMEIARGDGTRCPILVHAAPVRGSEGRIVAAVGIFSDVTEMKRAEHENRELAARQRAARLEAEGAQRRLSLLAEISQFLLASLDYQAAISGLARLVLPSLGDGCFIEVEDRDEGRRVAIAHINPRKAGLLQALEQVHGMRELLGGALSNALRTGRPDRGDRVTIASELPRSGEDAERQAIMRAIDPRAYMVIPLVTRGRVLGAMAFLLTETDRRYSSDDLDFAQHVARRAATAVDNLRLYEEARQAQAAAEDANRLKDDFLATLSHELRTPLNAILGWARMLRTRSLDSPTRDKALGTIERNALAQAQIVEDLLDVSRVITGSLRLDLQPVDMGALIESAVTTIRPAAEAKGIDLNCRVERVPPMVGDPGRLQQVVWNLLSNATKFTPSGGSIEVRVEPRDSAVYVYVSDTGVGISPEFLPHVFERFRQADSTSTRVHGGLGLGLAIVRHLVELHGGTVEASSAGSGKGATFTVCLPLRPVSRFLEERHAAPGSLAVPAKAAVDTLLVGVDVLVVDDEPDARELVAAVLRQHGATVRTAASVHAALDLLKESKPGVLVADIGMPGQDGYALMRQVQRAHLAVPAIALTAYARPDDRRRALDAGFEMHLSKPVEPDELVSVVADLAGRASSILPSRRP